MGSSVNWEDTGGALPSDISRAADGVLAEVSPEQQGSARDQAGQAGGTLETSRKSRMPLGEDESKVRRCVLLCASSAMNLSAGVVTSGASAHASRHARSVGRCAGYSQSNSRPARAPRVTHDEFCGSTIEALRACCAQSLATNLSAGVGHVLRVQPVEQHAFSAARHKPSAGSATRYSQSNSRPARAPRQGFTTPTPQAPHARKSGAACAWVGNQRRNQQICCLACVSVPVDMLQRPVTLP